MDSKIKKVRIQVRQLTLLRHQLLLDFLGLLAEVILLLFDPQGLFAGSDRSALMYEYAGYDERMKHVMKE